MRGTKLIDRLDSRHRRLGIIAVNQSDGLLDYDFIKKIMENIVVLNVRKMIHTKSKEVLMIFVCSSHLFPKAGHITSDKELIEAVANFNADMFRFDIAPDGKTLITALFKERPKKSNIIVPGGIIVPSKEELN